MHITHLVMFKFLTGATEQSDSAPDSVMVQYAVRSINTDFALRGINTDYKAGKTKTDYEVPED